MKPGERWLIVNADDFGLSEGVDRGIIQAHEHGIVTSASLMVRHTSARPAADCARGRAKLGVGLHLDLGEWEFGDESWTPLYEVVPLADSVARMAIPRQELRQGAYPQPPARLGVLGVAADAQRLGVDRVHPESPRQAFHDSKQIRLQFRQQGHDRRHAEPVGQRRLSSAQEA